VRWAAGISASLSFIHGSIGAGPEAMVLRGSERRMYQLGGVARLHGMRGNAGLRFGAGRAALVLEVRGHLSLGHDAFFGSRDMFSISGGCRVSW